jgi:hypothetical protein
VERVVDALFHLTQEGQARNGVHGTVPKDVYPWDRVLSAPLLQVRTEYDGNATFCGGFGMVDAAE